MLFDVLRRMKPFSLGLSRDYMGHFGHRVTEAIAKGISIKGKEGPLYVVPQWLELGDSPFTEEIRMGFFLSKTKPEIDKVEWGVPEKPHPISSSPETASEEARQPLFYFTFTSEMSVAQNMKDFRRFASEMATRGAVPPQVTA